MSGIGKDGDYPGGEGRRKVDHWFARSWNRQRSSNTKGWPCC